MLVNLLSRYVMTLPGFSVLVIIILFCFLEIQKQENELKLGSGNILLDKRFWYTPRDVESFLTYINETKGREGLNLYVWIHIVPDVIFPIAYGTFLAALIIRFYGTEIDWKLVIPILAVMFDLGENFTTAYLAWSYPNISSLLAWLAYGCTLMKWIMIIFSVILIFVGGLKKLI
jgi:hypothetical protein